jgi:hypothetical protein
MVADAGFGTPAAVARYVRRSFHCCVPKVAACDVGQLDPAATGTDQDAGATTVAVVDGRAVAPGAVGSGVPAAVHEVTPTTRPSRENRRTA